MADIVKPEKKKAVKQPKEKSKVQMTTADKVQNNSQSEMSLPQSEALPSRLNKEYLIQARWKSAVFLKQVVESIKDLISQTNMDWDTDGIKIQGMDVAHIALSNIFLSSDDCEFYHIKESITVGLDMLRLSKILAMANANDSCELFIKSDDESSLSILIESPDQLKKSLFEIPLLEIEMEFLDIPETHYNYEVQLPSSEIPCALREMSFLGDVAFMTLESTEFQMKIQGDNGKGIRSWNGDILKIRTNSDSFSQPFPVKYLSLAMKATATTQTVILEMSENSPLRIRCMFGRGSSIVNFVAPKIIDEE